MKLDINRWIKIGLWNLGSVTQEVHNLIDNIPTSISGTSLTGMADRSRDYAGRFIGVEIGSDSIDLKYQDIILNGTIARLVKPLALQGGDASKIKLGDFTIDKTNSSSIDAAAAYYNELVDDDLNLIGRKVSHYQLFG